MAQSLNRTFGTRACRARRRGSSYVMILSVSTVLTVIGLSAATVGRVNTRSTEQANHYGDAQAQAFSGAEHALAEINATTDWRNELQGANVQRTLEGGSFTWQVIDEADNDLTDDPSDPAVLVITGTAGDSVYTLKIQLTGQGMESDSGGDPDTTLWGVDEDDGELFKVRDYFWPALTATRYGRLKYRNGDRIRDIGNDIEGFTLDCDGTAYMVCNDDVGSYDDPVLLKFNVHDARRNANNIVTIVGEINWSGDITGLAIDPTTNKLYGLGQRGGSSTTDHLIQIDKSNGSVVLDVGKMEGLGKDVDDGEDLEFDHQGNLYVVDDDHDRLYKVDRDTAAITEVVDSRLCYSGKYEALAWEPSSGRLLGSHTSTRLLFRITFRNGHNVPYGSFGLACLTDVEGMGFIPVDRSGSGNSVRPASSPTAIQRVVQ